MLIVALLPLQKGDDNSKNKISGTIFCQQDGRKGSIPLSGATISLISGKDTLHTVSDISGRYSFEFDHALEVTIIAKYQGFEDYCKTYQIFEDRTAIAIKMVQSKEQLDAAIIKDKISFVNVVADTVVYNMSAMEKMGGDRAVDILLQIPGFGINNGRITVWGEYIDKTYVNGRLIYGDDPLSALSLLRAEEIKNVRVYDVQHMKDKHRGIKNCKKRRVIDVQTFHQFMSAVDLQAQSRIGVIYGEENTASPRYSSGVDFDTNQEMQQLSIHMNGNNIDDERNGIEVVKNAPSTLYSDKKHFNANFEFVKKWNDAEWGNAISVSYSFETDDNRSPSSTVIERAKTTDGIKPLHYEETGLNCDLKKYHMATISSELHQTPLKDISLGLGVCFDKSMNEYSSSILSDSGVEGTYSQNQSSSDKGRGFSIAPYISWSAPNIVDGWTPSARLSYYHSSNLSQSYTIDTLVSSSTRRYLEGNGSGDQRQLSGALSLMKTISDSGLLTTELEMIYQVDYTHSIKNRLTFDNLLSGNDPIDYTNSFDYSWNSIKQSAIAVFTISSPVTQLLEIRAGIASDKQIDVEEFPSEISSSHKFTTPHIVLSVTPPLLKNKLILSYSLMGESPALEQLRQRVDNSNPLRVRIGNQNLKAPLKHSMGFSYFTHPGGDGSFFAIQSGLQFVQNAIVERIRYYSNSFSTSEWGTAFQIPAGGTLTNYENARLAADMFCSTSYDCRIPAIKGTFKSDIRFNLINTPEYDDDVIIHSTGYGPQLNLSLITMPVKALRLNFSNLANFTKYTNSLSATMSEVYMDNCTVMAEIHFLEHAFLDASYTATFYRYFSDMGNDTNIHNLKCSLGYLFLKGRLAASISGSDILGKALTYSTQTTGSEFISISGNSLGRYCLLNISYRFSEKQ